MKAVVLARGKGTRMRRPDPAAAADAAQARSPTAGLKAMIPFRRPFLDYILSALADAGCDDVCLVIGPEHDVVRDYYDRISPPERVRVTFAVQVEARGTADAVLSANRSRDAAVHRPECRQLLSGRRVAGLVALDGPGLPVFRRSTLIAEATSIRCACAVMRC